MNAPLRLPPPSAQALLDWYDAHARALPWRVAPAARRAGTRPDAYRVWLSEIMLQQTTVKAVGPYFAAFLKLWPTVTDLAAADEAEVMKAWAGLGYYSRARNLKRAAETVASEHGGCFPETEAALRALPGIGPYTAAAIAAIAFDVPATVVDGNVERVVARLFAVAQPMPAAKVEIKRLAATLTPKVRPGDFAQAMMDLGATICTPARPACTICPWMASCRARAEGAPTAYPVAAAKAVRPLRRGRAYVAVRADGAVLLRRRPPRGLLGGMSEPPGGPWIGVATDGILPAKRTARSRDVSVDEPPLAGAWRRVAAPVRHGFTHFELELDVLRADIGETVPAPEGMWWSAPSVLAEEALPTVFRKVIEAALDRPLQRRSIAG